MFFRTIVFNKYSESVSGVYIENVEVKCYKNDGEIEIRIKRGFSLNNIPRCIIRVPMLLNGDVELEKIFMHGNQLDKQEMLEIANEVLA